MAKETKAFNRRVWVCNHFKKITMTADIKGALERIDTAYRMFEHNGRNLTKDEVRAILKYGQTKGYTNTGQISDAEVDEVLKSCFYKKMDKDLKFCF